jgi:hypothetical protein
MNLARAKKAVVAALGTAATIAATIPTDTPLWRAAQIVLALATIDGVYRISNAPQAVPSRAAQRAQLADEITETPRSSRIADEQAARRPRRPPPPDPDRRREG